MNKEYKKWLNKCERLRLKYLALLEKTLRVRESYEAEKARFQITYDENGEHCFLDGKEIKRVL